ncbi:DUF4259 domain-containing protein [Micromonospora sp. NBC_01796]|uniref:DUF4259 domain-containing protein n=1 Tax=Micromonospora sp. NBC_01796 TaxID=2975987 RepID=UPI002DDC0FBF|nr:DUF4259 domain-containing protein [Micromonospora sp. NBC_01796]WSA88845.1 DUF4259 domain-containing protein [Micromonospora sp. NBC_01796]
MGSWGRGNFDSDTAADHLGAVTGRLLDEVARAMSGDPVEIEPDEYWGVAVPCNLELLCLLSEQRYVGVELPSEQTIADWKQRYLAVWDDSIGGLEPTGDYVTQRRATLVSTFDRLAAEARRQAGTDRD